MADRKAWELVFEELERLGFKRTYIPEDQDGSELIFQEGLFQFVIGESDVIQEDLTAADVIRKLVQSLTNRESQESELSRLFGTSVTIDLEPEGEPAWTPTPVRSVSTPFKRQKPTDARRTLFPPVRGK